VLALDKSDVIVYIESGRVLPSTIRPPFRGRP
jgi:hypothetical protein